MGHSVAVTPNYVVKGGVVEVEVDFDVVRKDGAALRRFSPARCYDNHGLVGRLSWIC